MGGMSDSECLDLMLATQKELNRPNIQFIAQDLQDYIAMGRMMDRKVEYDGGVGFQQTLMLKNVDTAQFRGLFDEDKVQIENLLQQMSVNWVNISNSWGWDKGEVSRNKGKYLVNNIINPRRANCMLGLFNKMEDAFLGAVPSVTETKAPYGLKYWIVKDTTGVPGFLGAAPSGYTTVGGINPTTYPRFKNWTDQYTNVSVDDLVAKMRKAAYKTNFKSPKFLSSDLKTPSQSNKLIMTTYDVYDNLVRLTQQQNDNLGGDLDKFNGGVYFNKLEILPVPKLDELATTDGHDVYMINFDTFFPVVLSSEFMNESDPIRVANKHSVWSQFIDLSFNWVCTDRRSNAVIDAA